MLKTVSRLPDAETPWFRRGKCHVCLDRKRASGRDLESARIEPVAPPLVRTPNQARKEATLLEHLSHPNIVGFWESFFHGPSEGLLCIVMDYADGGDLGDYLKKQNERLLDEELIFDW